MSLTTCNVICIVNDDTGQPVQGATVDAKLSSFEVYNGYVVPQVVSGTTDANGQATLALWPNQLGSVESVYNVTISAPNGKRLKTTAIVPNLSSAYLHLISELPPYDGKSEGQLMLEAAVEAGSVSTAKAVESSNSAAAASASQAAASTSATNAAASAASAASSATTATAKASEAVTSANSAAASASTATTKASDAGISAASAATSASTASTKASEAAISATGAAASASTSTTKATDAAGSATAASTSATSAQASASTATTKASEASTSATAASTSATNASNSASQAATSATNSSTSASLAQDWATKTSEEVVAGQGYGAKKYAQDASTSATAAAGSATTASTSASTATTKASEASASASAASTSASNASNSATAASGSATTAQTAASTATTQASNASSSANAAAAAAAQAASSAGAATAGGIRFDTAQSLSTPEKVQARSNIGLAAVASTGSYSDLTGVPVNVSSFSNDAGYLTSWGGSLSNNINFVGTGRRITGDMSSGTVADRLLLQTSTANGSSFVTVIPNGTAVNSQFQAYNSSDPANASIAALVASATQVRIVSGYIGTGTLNPITFIFSNTEAARFDPTTKNFLIGTSVDNTADKLQVAGSGYFATAARSVTSGDDGTINLVSTTALAADKGGSLTFSGVYASNGGITRFAAIGGFKENATDNAYGGYLAFFSRDNGGQLLERGRASPAGNWLLGTTTDNGVDKLQVAGTSYFSGLVKGALGFTAPSNTSGAGTKLLLQGSTGTGAASTTGGNGHVEILGGGAVSTWTSFFGGIRTRQRGGVLILSGTAQADSGNTYVHGSSVEIRASNGTNNGTNTGAGGVLGLYSGSTTMPGGYVSNGGSFYLTNATASASSAANMNAGNFSSSNGTNNGSSIYISGSTATTSGDIRLTLGFTAIPGSTSGKALLNRGGVDYEILDAGNISSYAGTVPMATDGSTSILIGRSTIPGAGYGNVSLGISALAVLAGGSENVAVGKSCLASNDGGFGNTAVGYYALSSCTNNQNTALGDRAMWQTTIGSACTAVGTYSLYSNVNGDGNTAIGYNSSGANISGVSNTSLGLNALSQNSTGSSNTALGVGALQIATDGSAQTNFNNTTGVGASTQVSGSNQVQLGSSSTTTYVYGTVQNRSDIRDKADVRDTVLGLDFVMRLRPVDYRWDMREDYFELEEYEVEYPDIEEYNEEEQYTETVEVSAVFDSDGNETQAATTQEVVRTRQIHKTRTVVKTRIDTRPKRLERDGSKKRSRFHHGLIAQEVKQIIEQTGVDFGGFQHHSVNGGCDVMSIGYDEMVAPLIKSVQQLYARVVALEAAAA